MDDRTLLELAARAAGDSVWHDGFGYVSRLHGNRWNPLESDADALRLAVTLRMCVQHDDSAVLAGWVARQRGAPTHDGIGPWFWKEWLRDHDNDRHAATRRAIVRAAAALGEKGEQP